MYPGTFKSTTHLHLGLIFTKIFGPYFINNYLPVSRCGAVKGLLCNVGVTQYGGNTLLQGLMLVSSLFHVLARGVYKVQRSNNYSTRVDCLACLFTFGKRDAVDLPQSTLDARHPQGPRVLITRRARPFSGL